MNFFAVNRLILSPSGVVGCAIMALLVATLTPALFAAQVSLAVSKDNTLFESLTGDRSDGSGPTIFAGRTAQGTAFLRRGLLAFDLSAAIPAGATIDSVNLTMTVTKVSPGAPAAAFGLHRALQDWGEGASNAGATGGTGAPATIGDATWLYTLFNTETWVTPGGSFAQDASSTVEVTHPRAYTWSSTPQLVSDVQTWLDQPATNFGWLLIGDEGSAGTAKAFASREHSTVAIRPRLDIAFTPPLDGQLGDTNSDGKVDITDLNNVRNNFGSAGLGDTDDDHDIDITDLNNVRNNFGAIAQTAVPEPTSYTLFVIGLIGMVGVVRRRTRR